MLKRMGLMATSILILDLCSTYIINAEIVFERFRKNISVPLNFEKNYSSKLMNELMDHKENSSYQLFSIDSVCPPNFRRVDNLKFCYKILSASRSIPAATKDCQNAGGELLSIDSAEEAEWVMQEARKMKRSFHKTTNSYAILIALQKTCENGWSWLNGETHERNSTGKYLAAMPWHEGEPNWGSCAQIWFNGINDENGGIDDIDCNWLYCDGSRDAFCKASKLWRFHFREVRSSQISYGHGPMSTLSPYIETTDSQQFDKTAFLID